MSEPERIEFAPAEAAAPFPLPKWARATAFVGLYALVLGGMNQLEQSVVALLAFAGVDGSPLKSFGVMAGLYIGVMGMPSLLYMPRTDRNEGLYDTACSLVTALLAFVAAVVTLIAVRVGAPEMQSTTFDAVAPFVAGIAILVIGSLVTVLATRRRRRLVGATATENEGDEG